MKKFLAVTLALLMIASVLPMSTFAAEGDSAIATVASSCSYYNLIEKNIYNLAPGAVESEIIINNDEGSRRQVVHVIEVDPTNDNISVMPTFKNISNDVDYTDTNNWGIMEMSKQAAYIESTLGKNVVGAMNVCLSWSFNHPYGLLLYEGEVLHDSRASCDSCGTAHPGGGYLVIYKDGKAELREANAPLTGEEWMAQTICFAWLVKNGVSMHPTENHSSDPAPRSVIGVKADGSLVLMMVDGRMAPYSEGFNSHEMAQMMLDLGCVDAINCDGGGSSTFITEREGTGELSVKSRFSDGAERATLTGIAIISKAVADGKFHHASVATENAYVTPGSTVNFTAIGADSSGGPADIPDNITWQLEDSTMGTIENGVFVSNGKVGTAVAQMMYEGQVVGQASVEVVVPDSISFTMENITAPYGKTVSLDLVAKYGYSEVLLKEGDVSYVLSDANIGTIDGKTLYATDAEEVTGGTVKAILTHNTDLFAEANITLGKGSEIAYDFESGAESIGNWTLSYKAPYTPDKYFFNDTIEVVSINDGGKVKNGNYALKITADGDSITCMNWCQTRINGLGLDLTDAVSISFWMYIPEGSHGYEWDFGNAIPIVLGHEFAYGTGWQYFTVKVADIGTNVTRLDQIKLYHSDTNNAGIGYNHYEHPNYYADVVYYMDDITINYSTAVEDFQAPVISNASISYEGIDTAVALNGQTITSNVVAVTANAKDNTENSNYTGLNVASATVYVDGAKVSASCNDNGLITTGDITLANGVHIFRFEISDNNGNTTYVEKRVVVAGASDQNTIVYAPADPTLKDVPVDSLVWMNLTATAIEKVSNVTVVVDLDNNNKWELDHMVLPVGFTATYVVDAENNDATITITRSGVNDQTGEAVLASLPIRVWSPAFPRSENEDTFSYRLVSVMTYVQAGTLVETDSNITTFASAEYSISTEYNSTRLTSTVDKTTWHAHNEVALEDVVASCTAEGYTGRTFCEDCNSVVNWGVTVPATGHEFVITDGKLSCKDCGENSSHTGLYEDGENYYYLYNGVVNTGWQLIDDEYYYFDATTKVAVNGTVNIEGVYFNFDETGKLLSGTWVNAFHGWMYSYGPGYHRRGWYEIDGEMYYFNNYYRSVGYVKVPLPDNSGDGWCHFDENGAYIETLDGIYNKDGTLYYYDNGTLTVAGLMEIDGNYYFADVDGVIAVGRKYVWKTNGLLPEAAYYFDEDGKMIGASADGEIVTIDNVRYYFVNGIATAAGLVEIDGYYYFADVDGVIATGRKYVWKPNDILSEGAYYFAEDGKMIGSKVTGNGSVEGEIAKIGDTLYYCEMGSPVAAGLVLIDGYYYFADVNGEIATGKKYVWKPNGVVKEDNYYFAEDGKMLGIKVVDGETVLGEIVTEADETLRYYEAGTVKAAGLVLIDGYYYFAGVEGEIATGRKYVWKPNGLVTEDNYYFAEDGKMLGVKVVDGETVLGEIVTEASGTMRYYKNGKPAMAGLVLVDGYYYFAGIEGEISTGRTYVWKPNGLVTEDNYYFAEDGKMLGVKVVDGETVLGQIAERDDVLYYFEYGVPTAAGFVEVDGAYYFADVNGIVAIGKKHVWKGNGIVPEGSYEFGADGKAICGFVTKVDGIYYYEMGKCGTVGINYIDGYYYFVDNGGKIVTDSYFYVWKGNGLLKRGHYQFNELGQIVA